MEGLGSCEESGNDTKRKTHVNLKGDGVGRGAESGELYRKVAPDVR